MRLKIDFCEHYCVQMTFRNPGYNRKTLIKKRTSILDVACFNYKQLFHPIQCIACRKCQCSSRGKLAEQEVVCIHSTSNPFQYP